MTPFSTHTGTVAAMDRSNVDTDQIIPKQFLKRIERTGFGRFLFFDWRFANDGQPNPEFELNLPESEGASILLVRRNFGSGSSREHAVWALEDYGFRCVIGETFGDIFHNNCFKNGVLPITLPSEAVADLFEQHRRDAKLQISVDLPSQSVSVGKDWTRTFEIDGFRKECLLNGHDDIALTLQHSDKIAAFEDKRGLKPIAT